MYDPTEPGHVPVYNLHNIPAPPPPPKPPQLPALNNWQTALYFIVVAFIIIGIGIGAQFLTTPH